MPDFTPGPYHVGPHYKSDVESRYGRVCECTPMGSPRAEANARLFAAAPDLYNGLKLMVTCFPAAIAALPDESRDMIFGAIAQVEGRG